MIGLHWLNNNFRHHWNHGFFRFQGPVLVLHVTDSSWNCDNAIDSSFFDKTASSFNSSLLAG
jgi:hypothetical protein